MSADSVVNRREVPAWPGSEPQPQPQPQPRPRSRASTRGRTRGGLLAVSAGCGLALGFTVSRLGFGDYGELNRMFTFRDLRMFLAFGGGVTLAALAMLLLKGRPVSQNPVHRGVVPGAVLFGIGWAISGGCPAIPIIQVAQGYLPALITIAGIVTGMYLCRWFTRRVFPVDRGSCG